MLHLGLVLLLLLLIDFPFPIACHLLAWLGWFHSCDSSYTLIYILVVDYFCHSVQLIVQVLLFYYFRDKI